MAFQTALPSQTGNAGKVPTTDGTNASWTEIKTINGASLLGSTADLLLEQSANKDATGGYAGLTLFKINFKNAANTFTSFFTNSNTAARTYTFPDYDGTVAMLSDVAAFPVQRINTNTTAVPNVTYVIYGACTLTAPAISGNRKQFGIVVLPGVTGAIFAPAGADKTRGASGSQPIDAPFSATLTDSGATDGWI